MDDSASSTLFKKLKRLYRVVTGLKTKVKQQEGARGMEEGNTSQMLSMGEDGVNTDAEEEAEYKEYVVVHVPHPVILTRLFYGRLAETIHDLLQHSLDPKVPVSLRNIPTKYNVTGHLWTFAFHKLLEALRRSSFTSPTGLKHLQDYIYYAHTFYAGLLEDTAPSGFKSN
jgi:protein SMG6